MSKATALSSADISKRISPLSDWILGAENKAIHAEYGFKNYAESLAFVNKLSEYAEAANHHPDINFGWGYVDITLSTHDADGLTDKDFDLATKISKILA